VTSRRQRVGLAHLDLRLNRLRDIGDYVSRDFESAESCTLSARTIVPID